MLFDCLSIGKERKKEKKEKKEKERKGGKRKERFDFAECMWKVKTEIFM